MLLVLTSSGDATASYLVPILEQNNVEVARIDTDALVANLSVSYRPGAAAIKLNERWLNADSVTNVWYRRLERLKDSRFDESAEGRYTLAEWTESIEGFLAHIPEHLWVNHPARNVTASHKIEQLTIARRLGFTIPDTIVTQDSEALLQFYRVHQKVIAKPMASGCVKRAGERPESLIYTTQITCDHLTDLADLAVCPTLFQEYVDKSADVRISVIDHDVHAVALYAIDNDGKQRCDIRRNNMTDVRYETIQLPARVTTAIGNLMAYYQLRFGAIDMVVATSGEWYFLEINPNGQWAWLDMCAGCNIAASFVNTFQQH
jgi:glutathione synthase/RimK-type ligase-like ATP-grasp enzyme